MGGALFQPPKSSSAVTLGPLVAVCMPPLPLPEVKSPLLPQPKSLLIGADVVTATFEMFDSGVLHTSSEPQASVPPQPAPDDALAAVAVVVRGGAADLCVGWVEERLKMDAVGAGAAAFADGDTIDSVAEKSKISLLFGTAAEEKMKSSMSEVLSEGTCLPTLGLESRAPNVFEESVPRLAGGACEEAALMYCGVELKKSPPAKAFDVWTAAGVDFWLKEPRLPKGVVAFVCASATGDLGPPKSSPLKALFIPPMDDCEDCC